MSAPPTRALREDTFARFQKFAKLDSDWAMAVAEIERLRLAVEGEEFYRLTEVARRLGVSAQTVRGWESKGMIHTVQWEGVSGKRVSKSEFIRFVNATYGASK